MRGGGQLGHRVRRQQVRVMSDTVGFGSGGICNIALFQRVAQGCGCTLYLAQLQRGGVRIEEKTPSMALVPPFAGPTCGPYPQFAERKGMLSWKYFCEPSETML